MNCRNLRIGAAGVFTVLGLIAETLNAQTTHTWDGGSATSNNWSDAANWDAAGAPTQPGTGVANIVFGGGLRLTPLVQAPYDVNSLRFNSSAGAFAIGGAGSLTVGGGGIANNDTQQQAFIVPLVLGANPTWNAASGDLAYSAVTFNGNEITLDGANDHFFGSPVTGPTGSIIKNGAGNVTFSGNSSSLAAFTLNAGTLQINSATGTLGAAAVTLNGGSIEAFGSTRTLINTLALRGDFSTVGIQNLTFSGAATLNDDRAITIDNSALTSFSGIIGQDAAGRGITKLGAGTLQFVGASANTYTGTTAVHEGTLILAKSSGVNAVAGNLTVGNGAGTDTVRLGASNQIPNTTVVTVNSSGVLDINGFSDVFLSLVIDRGAVTIGAGSLNIGTSVTMTGGSITSTGPGQLVLSGALNTNAADVAATIDGGFSIAGNIRTFTVADGSAAHDLDITAAVSGAGGGIIKNGPGVIRFAGGAANAFTVGVAINEGALLLAKPANVAAVGAGSITVGDGIGGTDADVLRLEQNHQIPDVNVSTVSVNPSGHFDLNGFNETIFNLQLNAGHVSGGTISFVGGVTSTAQSASATIASNVDLLGATTQFNVNDGSVADDLILSGVMQNGNFSKTGTGTLKITGTAANTATLFQVTTGTVIVEKNTGLDAVGGSQLIISDGAGPPQSDVLRYGANDHQLSDSISVLINSNGLFDLNGRSDTIGALIFNGGGVVETGPGTLTVSQVSSNLSATAGTINGNLNLNDGARLFSIANSPVSAIDLTVTATLSNGTLVKQGAGTLALSGSAMLSPISYQLDEGGLSASGLILAAAHSFVQNAGTFAGSLTNRGSFIYNSGAFSGQLTNEFTGIVAFNATLSGGAVIHTGTLRGQGRITNVVANGGTIRAENGTLTLAAAGNTNTGRIEAGAGAQVLYSQGLTTNSGQIALTGGAFDNNNVAMGNPGAIAGYGTLRTGGLTNTGTVNVGGSLDVLGPVTNDGTVSTQAGTTGRFFGPVNGPGGYPGTGTVMFLNTFSPGASPAVVNFGGDVVFGSEANLLMELGGTLPGAQHDQLAIAGNAALAGTLDVALIDGFVPGSNQDFVLATYGSRTGTFDAVEFPPLPADLTWSLDYGATALTLSVTSTLLPGDINQDGQVDRSDAALFTPHLGTSAGSVWTTGDFDGDGMTTLQDLALQQANFGAMLPAAPSAAAVPESDTWLVCMAGLLAAAGLRPRRPSRRSQKSQAPVANRRLSR
jgi:fibronectin-binding autotransporter adhesin